MAIELFLLFVCYKKESATGDFLSPLMPESINGTEEKLISDATQSTDLRAETNSMLIPHR